MFKVGDIVRIKPEHHDTARTLWGDVAYSKFEVEDVHHHLVWIKSLTGSFRASIHQDGLEIIPSVRQNPIHVPDQAVEGELEYLHQLYHGSPESMPFTDSSKAWWNKEEPQKCTCDFHTVILPFGCQCGGK